MRTKLRAWIVSIVAPHTPVLPSLVRRHGPMPHILQHMPADPMLHAGIASARVNAVPMPSASARISICCAAGSAENCCGVFFSFAMFSPPLFVHLLNRAHAGARPQCLTGFFHLLPKAHSFDVFQ